MWYSLDNVFITEDKYKYSISTSGLDSLLETGRQVEHKVGIPYYKTHCLRIQANPAGEVLL
jgi:hypothetical protein